MNLWDLGKEYSALLLDVFSGDWKTCSKPTMEADIFLIIFFIKNYFLFLYAKFVIFIITILFFYKKKNQNWNKIYNIIFKIIKFCKYYYQFYQENINL